ncbi:transcriptional regulator [Caballeronia sp. DA-9]|uniref:transcriptional regulator n=1 Tax=Caballeronia sp. DA-9 TaxID=3436237 RepID=UPI003F67F7F2
MDLKTYIATAPRGTASKLATALGISPSYLSQLASGLSSISPERCVAIERETFRAVTRKDMRPSDWRLIWPELETPRTAEAA